jgi:hypothetical protein
MENHALKSSLMVVQHHLLFNWSILFNILPVKYKKKFTQNYPTIKLWQREKKSIPYMYWGLNNIKSNTPNLSLIFV